MDAVHIKDAAGDTHHFPIMLDEGSDYTLVIRCERSSAEHYAAIVVDRWIAWADPPDRVGPDGERGFASAEFALALGRAGSRYVPPAAYTPWQKGRVERENTTVRSSMRKSVLHMGLRGADDMYLIGLEAAAAFHQREDSAEVPAAMMFFGQLLKLCGELYIDGEGLYHADDPSSVFAQPFKMRVAARQALERYHAKDVVRRSVAARTRTVQGVAVGQSVFVRQDFATTAAQRPQAARGCYLGPALMIGIKGRKVWLSFVGRCYLCAPEHIRDMAPDEHAGQQPHVAEAMDMVHLAARSKGHIDMPETTAHIRRICRAPPNSLP